MKLVKTISPVLLACSLLFSCRTQRFMYATPSANVCYFKEKNDSKLAVYYYEGGTGNNEKIKRINNYGFNVQAGYAYSNNWAVTAAYSSRTEKDSSFSNYDLSENKSEVNYKRTFFELGFGKFSFNRNKYSTGNVFFGIGFGNYTLNDTGIDSTDFYRKYHKTPFVSFYIQPSYNIVKAKYFRASAGFRINLMRYGNSSSTYTAAEKDYWSFDRLNNKLVFFAEPNINFQLSLPEADWLRLEMNANFIFFNLGYPVDTNLSKRNGGITLGITLNPAAAFYKRRK